MCGILGYSSAEDFSNYMESALATIQNRGPDHQSWQKVSDDTVFGHTRLSIIDLSENSNQPLWDANKRACIVFNGEIYNYKKLKSKLIGLGATFNSEGDGEVILNSFLYLGESWLDELEGIFSFALYSVVDDSILLVRDPYGVKPLYYTQTDNGIFFASEIKALLKFPCIDKALNYDAIWRSIVFLWSPGESTLLESVKKLEPGTLLKIKSNKVISKVKYWNWPLKEAINLSEKEHISSVTNALKESVESQLVSDVPVGSFLSGGVDSSLIVSMANESLKDSLTCFTIDSANEGNDGFVDDLPYAKKVAELLGVPLNVVQSQPDIVNDLHKMVYTLDEPQADPAPLSVLAISKQAKEKGVKVLLSGAGGDDLFTGYRRHKALQLEKFWSWLPKPLRTALQSQARKIPKSNPNLRRFSKAFSYAGLDANERLLSYFYWIDPQVVKSLFSEKVRTRLSDNPMDFILNKLDDMTTATPIEKMLFLDKNYFLIDHNFNYTDKMSMACGVEVRVPFLDKRVVAAAANIPDPLKQKNGVGKYILKKSAEQYLPKSIIYRSKSGFGAPLRSWLNNELKGLVDESLAKEKITQRGIFDADAVWSLIEADRSGKQDYSYPIFSLLCIEAWFKIFIDNDVE
ncbi:asparagine synthase (glutamine-hydrolyzing) [Pseudoalteromonas sp. DY56-GL79]|uniref:asparagine synthase (glutamine-hydrolyzing) n=1 Tax=Pseudoalteromonas sp. DY56-GL79 TaxID=2967131 RepID=UPI00352B5790